MGTKSTFKSVNAQAAAMVYTAIYDKYDLVESNTFTHISSEQNDACDKLSRGILVRDEGGDTSVYLTTEEQEQIDALVGLCNPLLTPIDEFSSVRHR